MKFRHVNIISKDWNRLADFYVKTFDCKIIPPIRKQFGEWLSKGTGLKNASHEGAHLALPGYPENPPTLEIYQYVTVDELNPIAPNTRGFGHLAFEVDDVQLTLKSVLENGGCENGKITSKSIEGVGTITFVYVRDPDGNLIELQNWMYE